MVNGTGPAHRRQRRTGRVVLGEIDDLRIYNRALTVAELQSDMNTPVGGTPPPPPADTQAPTAPAGLTASGQTQTQITSTCNASSDNVGVTGATAMVAKWDTHLECHRHELQLHRPHLRQTSHTLGSLMVFDAAGNRSTRPSVAASDPSLAPPVLARSPDILRRCLRHEPHRQFWQRQHRLDEV